MHHVWSTRSCAARLAHAWKARHFKVWDRGNTMQPAVSFSNLTRTGWPTWKLMDVWVFESGHFVIFCVPCRPARALLTDKGRRPAHLVALVDAHPTVQHSLSTEISNSRTSVFPERSLDFGRKITPGYKTFKKTDRFRGVGREDTLSPNSKFYVW